MHRHDVIVVGVGLAGLRAAGVLADGGLDVLVLEAADVVGGRQRTDEVDGFLLDRGFQVLNPAYPAVQRALDVEALGLRSYPTGVRVRRPDGRLVEVAHPVRHPSRIRATLASGLLHPAEVAAIVRWALPTVLEPRLALRGGDMSLAAAWDRLGVDGQLRAEVLEPFLAGVLADDAGATSDAFVRLLMRMFALGRPGLPADGIAAVPAQLARAATGAGARVRVAHRVERIERAGDAHLVRVAHGDTVTAPAVLVATEAPRAHALLGIDVPASRGLQTWWYTAPEPPSRSRMLHLDGARSGPILHTSIVSGTAPTYAPRDTYLVEATSLLHPSGTEHAHSERDVLRQLRRIWGASVDDWVQLRCDEIPHALPAQTPPLRTTTPAGVTPGVFVAGDHRDTASIQGALVSGERVAHAVLDALDGGRPH